MKVQVYTQLGKESGSVDLPDEVFAYDWNPDLVHQVLMSQMANQRANTANVKDRSEVSGGGKRPWAQKGSGRARHGSSRSPIWRHGGVTHGPTNERNYKQVIPRAMKNRALFALLSQKLRDGKLLFVDNISATSGKTKDADMIVKNLTAIEGFKTLNWKKHNNLFIATHDKVKTNSMAFRNLAYANIANMDQLNPLTIANSRYIIISNPTAVGTYLAGKK